MTVRRTQTRPDRSSSQGQDTQILPAYYPEEEPASRGIPGFTVAVLALLATAVVCVLAILLFSLLKRNAPATPPVNGSGTPLPTLVSPGQTASPGVSGQAQIRVDPAEGYINTLVTVTGQGWWPGEPVFVFLRSPQEGTGRGFSYAAAVADDTGNLRTAFTFPNEARWVGQPWADVIGRGTRSNMEAITRFTLVAPTPTNTVPVPTFPPTNTPTPVLPTDTPTPTGTPTPTPTSTALVITDWRGEYFANRELQGTPVLVRNDGLVDFNWGEGSPAPTVPVNGFSARWTRSRQFREGTFRFTLTVDDGVRLWVDNTLLIDEWHDGLGTYAADRYLTRGAHAVRIEYYENSGGAMILFDWQQVEAPTATPTPTPATGTPVPPSAWHGEYFANRRLDGDPVLVQDYMGELDLNWGEGSPGPSVPVDDFSAQWKQSRWFPAGTYRFHLTVDDGGRVWVDGDRLIRAWDGGPHYDITKDKYLDEGLHTIVVEFFEATGGAHIHMWIELLGR